MDGSDGQAFNNSPYVEIIGQILVIAIIVLFVVVVFVLFLHLYAKWFRRRIEQRPASHSSRRQRRRFDFAPGQDPAFARRAGLSPTILKSIPELTFNPVEFKEGLECAVCLSELVEGEKARLLPKCNHGFHVECIDMWFQSHSTCPLCRNTVDLEGSSSMASESTAEIDIQNLQENLASGNSSESPDLPTNVLFWGNETQVGTGGACLEESNSSSSAASASSTFSQSAISSSSSSSKLSTSRRGNNEMLVIDIPVSMSEHLSSSLYPDQEESKSPAPTRLRSLKRLLSREKRVNPCSSGSNSPSSGSCDIEQVRR